ncbi:MULTISPECIES: Zn(2+)-responsive transcriptional regulator [Marinomonas]|uniref:Zn(2+)-responsive transcriptional regulator n=1 Tax=Marinomonas TaxID=28253 RepID=UPI0010561AB6|nr:Zn(2+)-responsive transcriptional regulator [Marinomonas flavescens]
MYRIGELAKAFDVKNDTLRFYEKHGLLTPSSRSDSGYRMYSEEDKQILSFILRAKTVGFSLADIHELLSIEVDKANSACADVKVVVDAKLAEVETKMAELNHFQKSLKRLSNACCGGSESAADCTILEALASDVNNIHPEQHHHLNKERF